MGVAISHIRYRIQKCVDPNCWSSWDTHAAREFYRIEGVLGKGTFSEVVSAVQKDNGRRVALKVVFLDNPRLRKRHKMVLRNEVDIMRRLDHINICKVDCVIEDHVRQQIVIAEEICHGGSLLEELQEADANSDRLLAFIFKQLFSAVAYVHKNRVIHRDLKPENIIFRFKHADWAHKGSVPVLIDFGMATRYSSRRPECGTLGSPGYVAPEAIKGKTHTPAMDMFALGVILFLAVVGIKPMSNVQAKRLEYANTQAQDYVNMTDVLWQSANDDVKDLILKLLECDPEKRATAEQCLKHPWIVQDMQVDRSLHVGAANNTSNVKKERLLEVAKTANAEQLLELMALAMKPGVKAQWNKPKSHSAHPGMMPTIRSGRPQRLRSQGPGHLHSTASIDRATGSPRASTSHDGLERRSRSLASGLQRTSDPSVKEPPVHLANDMITGLQAHLMMVERSSALLPDGFPHLKPGAVDGPEAGPSIDFAPRPTNGKGQGDVHSQNSFVGRPSRDHSASPEIPGTPSTTMSRFESVRDRARREVHAKQWRTATRPESEMSEDDCHISESDVAEAIADLEAKPGVTNKFALARLSMMQKSLALDS